MICISNGWTAVISAGISALIVFAIMKYVGKKEE